MTRRALVSLSVLIAWLIFAMQIVPPLIVRAYDGQSLPLFNALIISRADHPLIEYLSYWRNVTWLGAFWCIAVWLLQPLRQTLASPLLSPVSSALQLQARSAPSAPGCAGFR